MPDLDEAIAFYRDTFGMETVHEETNEEQGVREAMVAVGDSGSCIQLLAPLAPDSTIAKFLDRSGPGMQQLAYRVEDVDAVSATLRERGVRLLYDVPRRRHVRLAGQLRPPQGRRRGARSSWSSPPSADEVAESARPVTPTTGRHATAVLPLAQTGPRAVRGTLTSRAMQQIRDAILAGDTRARSSPPSRCPSPTAP